MYDYLIVGAGLFGCTFARLATDAGKKCLIIEKREHIAGNCYTEKNMAFTNIYMVPISFIAMMMIYGIL